LADGEIMEKQFEEFKQQLEDSGNVRERLRIIVADLDSVTRVMQADLLQVHYSSRSPEILKKAKSHIGKLKELYGQLAEVIKGTPGQYYRYHDHWRNQTNTVVFLIVYLNWLETGNLLSYAETQDTLGLNPDEFGLDIEDYLIGLCNVSSELPRYVVNQVTIGDYDCPKRVSKFLSDLYAAFRILNLRNDFLRKRFDGMKYDLKKVEEVLYDVKIRKLDSSGSTIETKQEAS
jgi:predicted translin family RNA/ssDNA-binding protein